jgi:ABC-type polysaccharide/polyol phosphate export permease
MFRPALSDFAASLKRADLWLFLGWHDVRQRYRRSTLGPFWITLATAIFIGMMTAVYGGLFRQELRTFLPFVATGIVIWGLIAGCLTEGSNLFINASTVIRQVPAPLPVHLFRLVWQQIIYFGHNLVVIVLVLIIVQTPVGWSILLTVPAFILLVANLAWMILFLSSIGARYRDVPTIVQTFISALFIVTPVIWNIDFLSPERQWVAFVNPFTYLVEVMRLPMLGVVPSVSIWSTCIIMAALGWGMALTVYSWSRRQLAYWI